MLIKKFEDLEVWKSSRELNKKIYLLTSAALFNKDYGLKDQLQRASVSIMLNIAEGFASGSPKSFATFLRYSFRSSAEVKSILYAALDLKYIKQEDFIDISGKIERIQKLLSGLIKRLQTKANN